MADFIQLSPKSNGQKLIFIAFFAAPIVLGNKHIDCSRKQKPSGNILHKISMKHTHQQKSSGNVLQKIRYPCYWNYCNSISQYHIF